jgi:hypothetical protein
VSTPSADTEALFKELALAGKKKARGKAAANYTSGGA